MSSDQSAKIKLCSFNETNSTMSNVMAALLNIGGAVCESRVIPFLVPHRKLWMTPTARVPCSNAANIEEQKTWDAK